MKRLADKSPREVMDYGFSFEHDLAGSVASEPDAISSAAVEARPAGLVVGQVGHVGGIVVAWLSGGAPGVPYVVTARVATVGGRTFEISAHLLVTGP